VGHGSAKFIVFVYPEYTPRWGATIGCTSIRITE
jgi:hypothetical protein